MSMLEVLRNVLIGVGVGFFVVGSVGLLRFPDVYTRIHALTKADNLGLGLVMLGLLLGVESAATALKLVLIWLLALLGSACAGYLVARAAWQRGLAPWSVGPDSRSGPSDGRALGERAEADPPAFAAQGGALQANEGQSQAAREQHQ